MSYAELYQRVQSQGGRVSTKWLVGQAIELTHITQVKEQWSTKLDPAVIRGFYIEGPMGPPVPLNENEALIVLSHSMCKGPMGDYWRLFIKTKELMHVFDSEEEKTDSAEKLEVQLEKFGNPATGIPPQYFAEVKALWRAMGVLCTEARRLEIMESLKSERVSIDVAATTLHIPPLYVGSLIRENFPSIIESIMN
jgi:hypothetical protein